ncbi:predicted protein [Chaetomium globosum CBS 148.51]|uniref:Uncharacterized protein n=1 Tax=Chaetomium globosum (strain ATCC 6205 / CBS 148.51 / DSM 1962 / NBRC 6347 / NRRL 1970) TaxID=306901 RepID=Q2GTS7_CHAGB|nr:uncharacterized protein CHGG_08627 [Chaetomium globosum CBS 148.51]EAQ84613.1 predicted protein [Chaetomium globosum CBS 148.51]
MALEKLPASICHRHITVITRNQSALAAVGQPRQQSGQSIIRQIYDLARLHRQRGNSVNFLWIPAEIDFALGSDAKAAAQRASKQGRTPDSQIPQAKSTAMRLAMERQRATRVLPVSVGKFSKVMDAALPGKHTRHLYDKLKRREACWQDEEASRSIWEGKRHRIQGIGHQIMKAVRATIKYAMATGRLELNEEESLDQSQ